MAGFLEKLGRGLIRAARRGTGKRTDLQAAISIAASTIPRHKLEADIEAVEAVRFAVDLAVRFSKDPRIQTAAKYVDALAEALK